MAVARSDTYWRHGRNNVVATKNVEGSWVRYLMTIANARSARLGCRRSTVSHARINVQMVLKSSSHGCFELITDCFLGQENNGQGGCCPIGQKPKASGDGCEDDPDRDRKGTCFQNLSHDINIS